MTIGELAEKAGVTPRMLRYYEQQGLLTSGRGGNGYRLYGKATVGLVIQLRELIESGLPTRLVRTVLPWLGHQECDSTPSCEPLDQEEVAALRQHIHNIDRRIEVLSRNRSAIDEYLRLMGTNPLSADRHAGDVLDLDTSVNP
ncbi:MerR family DNA-binding transcriptional regulator [Streptomyces sp. NPDC088354]|uniref:MerR family DNA-binding transcriptional regulator n=1 Tax=unclassified Streptomyces TaxID=2593676 RepID=UPI0029B97088|nr:MerR family DNA-binding transcriptional regulator [Streptomyces sp. MI02-7b]MDX3071186.1 MerR family DNA-binding transcriptional regulator [Streptomyces sp. MI02-7b]